jgi:hypothetical protein
MAVEECPRRLLQFLGHFAGSQQLVLEILSHLNLDQLGQLFATNIQRLCRAVVPGYHDALF